jgi:hypothetical protein
VPEYAAAVTRAEESKRQFAGDFWRELKPDIVDGRESLDGQYFRPEYLDQYGDLDLVKAILAARDGETILLPGVAESYPDRLRLRHTR